MCSGAFLVSQMLFFIPAIFLFLQISCFFMNYRPSTVQFTTSFPQLFTTQNDLNVLFCEEHTLLQWNYNI